MGEQTDAARLEITQHCKLLQTHPLEKFVTALVQTEITGSARNNDNKAQKKHI